jgi:DNA primase
VVSGSGIDVAALKARVDLVDLAGRDTRLKKTASTRGGEWTGPCPRCGGRDRFHVQPATGLWYCRSCSPDGKWGDAISYVMWLHGVSFREACERLGASASELGEGRNRRIPTRSQQAEVHVADDIEPSDSWRARALDFVDQAAAVLWTDTGEKARAYLARRGLQEETLRAWRVGFQPSDAFEPAARWGVDGERVWLARGIVLPWLRGDIVDQVKIRRAVVEGDKYASIRGGHPLLYGADTLVPGQPAVMAEGEIDALLLHQAAHDRTATVSLGSATKLPSTRAALLLSQATPLFLAYDVDAEGDKGAERIQRLAPHARRIRPPSGKDVGEFVMAGGRARAWVIYELKRAEGGY